LTVCSLELPKALGSCLPSSAGHLPADPAFDRRMVSGYN
jgi:hypothetical protein